MSKHSKARRDARKKKQPGSRAKTPPLTVEPHGALFDADGSVRCGVGRRGDAWVFLLDGRIVTATESAGMSMAMLRHAASLHERDGLPVRVTLTTALRAAAMKEAEAEGKTLDAYLEMLETERAERLDSTNPPTADEPGHGSRDVA